jgi:hypothetical protein
VSLSFSLSLFLSEKFNKLDFPKHQTFIFWFSWQYHCQDSSFLATIHSLSASFEKCFYAWQLPVPGFWRVSKWIIVTPKDLSGFVRIRWIREKQLESLEVQVTNEWIKDILKWLSIKSICVSKYTFFQINFELKTSKTHHKF